MQSGMVPSHHPAPTHPTMMLMATQGPPGGPQPPMPQTALNPIPVSSTTHFSYLAHPQGMFITFFRQLDGSGSFHSRSNPEIPPDTSPLHYAFALPSSNPHRLHFKSATAQYCQTTGNHRITRDHSYRYVL